MVASTKAGGVSTDRAGTTGARWRGSGRCRSSWERSRSSSACRLSYNTSSLAVVSILVGVSLCYTGVTWLMMAFVDSEHRLFLAIAGALLLAGGVVAFVYPDETFASSRSSSAGRCCCPASSASLSRSRIATESTGGSARGRAAAARPRRLGRSRNRPLGDPAADDRGHLLRYRRRQLDRGGLPATSGQGVAGLDVGPDRATPARRPRDRVAASIRSACTSGLGRMRDDSSQTSEYTAADVSEGVRTQHSQDSAPPAEGTHIGSRCVIRPG